MKPNSPQLGRCSERDIELLSVYLDNQLSASEQAHLEHRLNTEPVLQHELEELRATVKTLQELAPAALPRSFMLNLDTVQQSKKPFLWLNASSLLLPIPKIHLAGAMAVLLVAFAFTTLYAIHEPQADTIQTVALNSAPQHDGDMQPLRQVGVADHVPPTEAAIEEGLASEGIESEESRSYSTQGTSDIVRETGGGGSNYAEDYDADDAALWFAATPSLVTIATTIDEHASSSPEAPRDTPLPSIQRSALQDETEAYPPTAPQTRASQQQQLSPPIAPEAQAEAEADTEPTEEVDTVDDTMTIGDTDTDAGDDTADDTMAMDEDHEEAGVDEMEEAARMDMPLTAPSHATKSAIVAQHTPSNSGNTPTILFIIALIVLTVGVGSWFLLRHRSRF